MALPLVVVVTAGVTLTGAAVAGGLLYLHFKDRAAQAHQESEHLRKQAQEEARRQQQQHQQARQRHAELLAEEDALLTLLRRARKMC